MSAPAAKLSSRKRRSATSGQTVAARSTEAQAVELRVKGFGYEAIAEQLGCNVSTAYRAVVRYLERTAADSAEALEQVRQLEVARLDLWLSKLAPKIEEGEEPAIDTALRIQARRAKLLGLDVDKGEPTIQVNVLVQSIAALTPPQQVEALRELVARAVAELPPARQERARALLAEAFASDDSEVPR